jgi:transposase-like protein
VLKQDICAKIQKNNNVIICNVRKKVRKKMCTKCKSENRVKSGFHRGKQRYLCKNCRCNYVENSCKGYLRKKNRKQSDTIMKVLVSGKSKDCLE